MRALRWALLLAIPVACGAAVQAAERIVPEGTTVQLLLLRQKSVQKELQLTPEVVKKIFDFTNKQHETFREVLKLSKEEREPKVGQMEKENKQFLADTLTKEQHKRLDQIALQVTGLTQLLRPDVAKALSLTKEQRQKVKEIQAAAHKELEEIIHGKNREGRNEKLAKLRAATRNKARALLSDEQKEKVKEMVGAPFEGELVFEDDDSKDK